MERSAEPGRRGPSSYRRWRSKKAMIGALARPPRRGLRLSLGGLMVDDLAGRGGATVCSGDRVGDQLHEVGRGVEGGCVAGPFNLMQSRGRDGSGERSGEAEHVAGASCAVAADDGDIDCREIGRRWIGADRVEEVCQGCIRVVPPGSPPILGAWRWCGCATGRSSSTACTTTPWLSRSSSVWSPRARSRDRVVTVTAARTWREETCRSR